MNIMDIVALARQGFTPADIKELIAESDSSGDLIEEGEQKTPEEGEQKTPEEDQVKDEPEADPEGAIDYKAKYEELEKRFSELQKESSETHNKLQKAQEHNVTKQITGNTETDSELITDFVRSFM